MGLFGRLEGKEPPALPPGARAYVDGFGPLRDEYCVRAKRLDEDDLGELIRGSFITSAGAEMYAAWCNHEGPLDWDINGPGKPV